MEDHSSERIERVGAGALGVGVIGCGYWGPNIIRNLAGNPRALVRGISDLDEERLGRAGRGAPQARLTTNFEELLADPEIEAVAIATPVSSHYRLGRRALEAGKHVLMTKPLAASVEECESLIDLAKAHDRVLLVDHTFVYTGAVRKMRQLVEEGVLGDIYYFDSVRVNLGLFQHDVNVIWDLAAHDFSIIANLFDKEPLRVSAIGACHSGSGLEDVAYVTLEFPNNFIAHCHINWLSPVKIRQTLIGGSEKMLVWNDLVADEKLRIYDRGITMENGEGIYQSLVGYRTGDVWTPQLERHEALSLEVEHFLDCIEKGAEPITGGQAGARVVRLLEATTASLAQGGQAVQLAELARE